MNRSARFGRIPTLVLLLGLSTRLLPAQTPEVFVQTGHASPVEKLALSDNQRYLVSAEDINLLKLWDVAAAREIRTVKFDGIVGNVYFIDNERFAVLLRDRMDIYNNSGILIDHMALPSIEGYGKVSISRSGKYIIENSGYPAGVRIFDIKDGAEFKLPEQKIDSFRSALIDLGSGYFGVFFDEYKRVPEIKNNGTTGFVILDENLQVKKRGVLKGIVGFGGKVKVDRGLKFVYELRDFGEQPQLGTFSLESGEQLCAIPVVKRPVQDFDITADGKVQIVYIARGEMVNLEYLVDVDISIMEIGDNCMYKEKKISLKDLAQPQSYAIGTNGILIASHRDGTIKRYDAFSGKETASLGVKPVTYGGISYANGKLIDLWQDFSVTAMEAKITYNLWNIKSASLEQFSVSNSTKKFFQKTDPGSGIVLWHMSEPDAFYSKIPKEFYPDGYDPHESDSYDRAIGYPYVYMRSPSTEDVSFSKKDAFLAAVRKSDKTEVARLYTFSNGEWVVITPEGYFNASPEGAKLLNVRVENNVYSIDNFYEKFYNPVLVASALQGGKVEAVADLRKGILAPPEVKIVSPAPGTVSATDNVTIVVSAKDVGGGVDEIRLYQNGKVVGGDVRGMKLVPKANEVVRTFTVTLLDDVNTFKATAFSKDRSESNPYELTVTLSAPKKEASLHLLVVGINTYKNPALNLNYAVPDAKGIAEFFRRDSRRLFKTIDVGELYNEQATKLSILGSFGRLQNTRAQDVVLIYLAGHGENILDKWYFIPYELTYPERESDVTAKALCSDELKESILKIKAQKILVLIDACKSGAVLVAFRGFEDRKALSQLSRATGVHVVAASAGNQFAAEVKELGHGVFTYTLLEGLGGKASAKGDAVTVRKLMSYIEEQLPEITKKYKQEAQYPVVDSRGMDFPLAPGR